MTARPPSERGSRLISRLLPAAVRLWIHSQLDHVEELQFQLNGRDGQILRGYVPAVSLGAARAVYQGLHLSQVEAEATDIRINLAQVLRGQPLRLLQPFPVAGAVLMREADLNASLQAPLLQQALRDFLQQLAASQPLLSPWPERLGRADLAAAQVSLQPQTLRLRLAPDLELVAGLQVRQGRILCLREPRLRQPSGDSPWQGAGMEIDLGPEVTIDTLALGVGQLQLQGRVNVIPAD